MPVGRLRICQFPVVFLKNNNLSSYDRKLCLPCSPPYSNAPRNFSGLGKRRKSERVREIEQLYYRYIVGPEILPSLHERGAVHDGTGEGGEVSPPLAPWALPVTAPWARARQDARGVYHADHRPRRPTEARQPSLIASRVPGTHHAQDSRSRSPPCRERKRSPCSPPHEQRGEFKRFKCAMRHCSRWHRSVSARRRGIARGHPGSTRRYPRTARFCYACLIRHRGPGQGDIRATRDVTSRFAKERG
jgi:hypothetical protein